MGKKINIQTFTEVENLFNKMKWDIKKNHKDITSPFNRFCARLTLLTPEQQSFIIELSSKLDIIPLKDYIERFLMSLFSLPQEVADSAEKIFICPLVSPYIKVPEGAAIVSKGKTKSANFLYYLLEANDLTWIDFHDKLFFEEDIERLQHNLTPNNSILILVDDFVGTGETAIDVCKIFLDKTYSGSKLNPERVFIVSIVAQNEGVQKVKKELNVNLLSDTIRNKGISDGYSSNVVADKIKLMLSIESKICSKNFLEKYSFGYGKSEALVSFMNKTPNNTFPFYWFETETKIAPFPRYKKYKNGPKHI